MYNNIKHCIEKPIALIMIIILAPILLFVCIAIIIESKGSPIFLQERIGMHRKIYNIIKFRTMVDKAVMTGSGIFTNANDSRITKVGKILRKYSIDEIPQLFNILKGDMSFIGPRPPLPYFPYKLNDYPEKYIERFNIRPGITGLAQTKGRTNITWTERFEYDLEYIKNNNIKYDVMIIIKTIIKVFSENNIYPDSAFVNKYHNENIYNDNK